MEQFGTASHDALISLAHGYGIELSNEQAVALLRHGDLVMGYNSVVNLTRITDPQDVLAKHVVDSLLFACMVPKEDAADPSLSFLDIGTGAGYPGIPLALVTRMQGVLIDSVAKKNLAVESFIRTLGLGMRLSALCIRSEDLAIRRPFEYDLVVSRAVAEPSILIELARPLLKDNGQLIVSAGQHFAASLSHALLAAKVCGMTLVGRKSFALPFEMGVRELLSFRVVADSSVPLPRRAGMARKRPLWQGKAQRI